MLRFKRESRTDDAETLSRIWPSCAECIAPETVSTENCARVASFSPSFGSLQQRPHCLVGAGGLEPPNGGIKIRCLTAWLRPKAQGEAISLLVRYSQRLRLLIAAC